MKVRIKNTLKMRDALCNPVKSPGISELLNIWTKNMGKRLKTISIAYPIISSIENDLLGSILKHPTKNSEFMDT